MSETDDEQPSDSSVGWREPLVAFGIVVASLGLLSGLSMVWPPVANHILALAAVVFVAVPFVILRRQNADFERFGIDLEKLPLRHVALALGVTLVVFPLYAVGHHLWETQFEDRQFHFEWDNYRQWPVELDTPSVVEPDRETLQVRTVSDDLLIEWSYPELDKPTVLSTSADEPFVWGRTHGMSVKPTADSPKTADGTEKIATEWLANPESPGDARLLLSVLDQPDNQPLPHELTLQLEELDHHTAPEVLVGGQAQPADEPIELRRTHWWLLLWALTHLILVALPEEYFYRGYLQTRIGELFGDEQRDKPVTFLGFTRANWLTSGFFALGHVLVPVGGVFAPARAAVFFPSLLFGWLRERTGSIIAPTVFHAAANMMVLVVAVHYF